MPVGRCGMSERAGTKRELILLRGYKHEVLSRICEAADQYKAGEISSLRLVNVVGHELAMDEPPLPESSHLYE